MRVLLNDTEVYGDYTNGDGHCARWGRGECSCQEPRNLEPQKLILEAEFCIILFAPLKFPAIIQFANSL